MKIRTSQIALLLAPLLLAGCQDTRAVQTHQSEPTPQGWRDTLEKRLPVFGHRNWIVVADWAYPKQSAPGIETVYTDAGQVEVLGEVLRAIDSADHVRPVIMCDAELESVTEAAAPGVDAYRSQLKELLGDRPVKVLPHEEIIGELDEGAKLFNILILKTDMTIPYTSVFIELDCGYWDARSEAELRKRVDGQ